MLRPRCIVLLASLAIAPSTVSAAPADSAAAPAQREMPPSAPPHGASAATPDYTNYQQLLNDLLTVISAKPLDTRFDYEKFYDMKGRAERCSRIRRGLFAVPPSAMDDRTRIAWAINVYNYLVIETATEYLLVPKRGRLRYKGPREIVTAKGALFVAALFDIEGQTYSLDSFERHFLFADFDRDKGGPPPPSLDPRIHFAVVCGALGCPPLQPRAYRGDSLEIQLEAATRNALALPRHLEFQEETGRIQASAIFQWYAVDFGGIDKAFEFVLKYAPAKTRAAIQRHKVNAIAGVIPWDWNLNQTAHKKEM